MDDGGSPRLAFFLDGPNVYREGKDLGKTIDPEQLLQLARPFGHVVSATVYFAMKDGVPADRLARLYNQAGFSVRFVPCTYNTKDVDTTMAVDIAEVACEPSADIVLIASGDGDFVPAVDLARRKGKSIVVCAFSENCNRALRVRADVFVALEDAWTPVREVTTYHA